MRTPARACIIALKSNGAPAVLQAARAGEMPRLGRLAAEGVLAPVVEAPSVEGFWRSLATGTWQATAAGGIAGQESLWEAARAAGWQTVLLGFPPDPDSTARPADLGAAVGGTWDLLAVGMTIPADAAGRVEADGALGAVVGAAGKDCLVVVAAAGGGSAFAVLSGPGIRRGAILERVVRVNDLAPTVAHLVELPVPPGTDGAVLHQAFHDPNVKTKQVRALRDGLARVEKALAEESWQPWHGTGEPAF